MPVELLQQHERRARLSAAQQYRAILVAVTRRTGDVLPTRPHKQARRVILRRQYDAGALRSRLRTYAHAHDAQVISVVQRAGGPRARLLVAQSTDDIATHQRPQQDQALTGIVLVYALRE